MTDTTRRGEKLPGQNRCLALSSISRLGLDEKQEKDPRTTGTHGDPATDGLAGPFHFIHACHGGGHRCPYFVAAVQFTNSNVLGTHGKRVVLCVCRGGGGAVSMCLGGGQCPCALFLSLRRGQDSDEAPDTRPTFRVWPISSHGVHSCPSKGPRQQLRLSNRTRP